LVETLELPLVANYIQQNSTEGHSTNYRLNNKKPILVIKSDDLATFKKKRVNQLGLVMILHELQAFTTTLYSKYSYV
jgi:hypothetical protein